MRGGGILNTIINKLPVELHLPGYRFCGPGTKLNKRLARGDVGINPLDEACREHDIAYAQNSDLASRHAADKVLKDKAWARLKAPNATAGERASALFVTSAMGTKRFFGAGTRLATLKAAIKRKNNAQKKKKKKPRVIKGPKRGGILPLLPIFAGLSALGALSGGISQITRAVNSAKSNKKQLSESERHNKTMEAIAMGKTSGSGLPLPLILAGLGTLATTIISKRKKKPPVGKGLYVRQYKQGKGLYVKQQPKQGKGMRLKKKP